MLEWYRRSKGASVYLSVNNRVFVDPDRQNFFTQGVNQFPTSLPFAADSIARMIPFTTWIHDKSVARSIYLFVDCPQLPRLVVSFD